MFLRLFLGTDFDLECKLQKDQRKEKQQEYGLLLSSKINLEINRIKQAACKESSNSLLLSLHHMLAFDELLGLAFRLYLLDKYKIEGRHVIRQYSFQGNPLNLLCFCPRAII